VPKKLGKLQIGKPGSVKKVCDLVFDFVFPLTPQWGKAGVVAEDFDIALVLQPFPDSGQQCGIKCCLLYMH